MLTHLKGRPFGRLRPGAGDHREVRRSRPARPRSSTLRPSLTTLLPAAKSRLASASISFLRKPFTTVSRSRLRLALGRGLDRGDERGLAGGTPAALAARPRAAEIGVVDLDPALRAWACRRRAAPSPPSASASSATPSAGACRAGAPARPSSSRPCSGSGGRSPETTWSAAVWSSGTPSRRSGRPDACSGCTSRAPGSSARRSGRGHRPGTPSLCPSAARTAPHGIAPRLPNRARNSASLSPVTRRRNPLSAPIQPPPGCLEPAQTLTK